MRQKRGCFLRLRQKSIAARALTPPVSHTLDAAQLLPSLHVLRSFCRAAGCRVTRESSLPSCVWPVGSRRRREAVVSAGNEWMKYVVAEEYKSGANYLSMTLDVKHNWKAKTLSRTWTYFRESFVKGILAYITLKNLSLLLKWLSHHVLTYRNQLDSFFQKEVPLSILSFFEAVLQGTPSLFWNLPNYTYIKAWFPYQP